ncbi:ribosomal L1 domain-containing protein CG13096 [Eurosta solidaginis]|uniref:ribosomal L1 domain-containing protein CG13096 n=1 Tax=Eurosta solidaginis TaxID=178769 RepID=UPI00353067D9
MVKLQKSLTKPLELIEKRKKKVSTPPLAGISKRSKKDKQNGSFEKAKMPKEPKLTKAIIEDKSLSVPKKVKKTKLGNGDEKPTAADFSEAPLKKLEKKKDAHKKPLVLVGLEKEQTTNSKKRPLVLAPPAAPKATDTLLNKKQKNKLKLQKKKVKKPTGVEHLTPLTKLKKKSAAKRAYKRQQIKLKREGKKKTKKSPLKRLFEAPPFDEDKFNAIVNEDNVKKIAKGLKKQVEKEVVEKKTAIFSDFQYFLNVACFKIPNAPKRVVKLNLKHSLVDKDDNVAIIVSDLQRGAKVDYDPTIQHYEDIFREAGIEGLTIIPFNKLRNECKTFETVRKFGNTYDYFLCDGRLVGHASGFCGKVFQKPRTTFHTVRMQNQKNLKREIEKSLSRTAYKQLQKGDLISIPIGNHKFTKGQIAENVMFVMEQLKKTYPGGFPNIRSMYLKISLAGTSALPIYVSVAEAPAETPNVIGPREKRMLKLKREANEVLSNFNMTKQADLLKLSKTDAKRKRKLQEMRAVIGSTNNIIIQNAEDSTSGKQSVVPAKKSKTEKSVGSSSSKAEKEKEKEEKPSIEKEDDDASDGDEGEAEQEGEDEHDSDEDDSDDGDNEDDDDDDDGDEDNEDDDDDDEDDDEAGDDSSENEDGDDDEDEDDE